MLRLLSSIFWLKLRKFLSLYPTFTIDKDVKRQLYWLAANGHVYEEFNNDICNEFRDEDNLIHKSTTENHEREVEFRSDQFWAFLLVKSKNQCILKCTKLFLMCTQFLARMHLLKAFLIKEKAHGQPVVI
ncbi:unnamed protein product [Rotaria socialis]|uniref:Uncharacterized protein n=1 Tax=Rotaria socialis TaxID=392032 RepID=A0A817XXS5_9BILA|nr:unnamed protein product [Rotaria socialis]